MSQKLIFIDIETTGLDTDTCEVIECAYQYDDRPTYTTLHKPQSPIPSEISGITNIDNIDVVYKQPFNESVGYVLIKQCADNDYIAVTHNTDFDLAVLERYGIKFNRSICTHKLSWKLLPDLPNHKLGTLRAYFGIPHGGGVAHRAGYDVEMLEQVFNKLQSLAFDNLQWGGNLDEPLPWLVGFSNQAKAEYQDIFHFGKYKGQKISDIAKSDFGYIQWLKNNTEDKKLKNYLGSL